jgi:hypothetical protein
MPVAKLGQNVIRQLSSGTTTNVSGYEDYILLVKTDKFSAVVIKASFEINFNQLNQKKIFCHVICKTKTSSNTFCRNSNCCSFNSLAKVIDIISK